MIDPKAEAEAIIEKWFNKNECNHNKGPAVNNMQSVIDSLTACVHSCLKDSIEKALLRIRQEVIEECLTIIKQKNKRNCGHAEKFIRTCRICRVSKRMYEEIAQKLREMEEDEDE